MKGASLDGQFLPHKPKNRVATRFWSRIVRVCFRLVTFALAAGKIGNAR
jgi:hypothetical protein